jgi:hypothetical protein
MHATSLDQLILIDVIIVITGNELGFIQLPITSALLGLKIILRTFFSNTLNLRSSNFRPIKNYRQVTVVHILIFMF